MRDEIGIVGCTAAGGGMPGKIPDLHQQFWIVCGIEGREINLKNVIWFRNWDNCYIFLFIFLGYSSKLWGFFPRWLWVMGYVRVWVKRGMG